MTLFAWIASAIIIGAVLVVVYLVFFYDPDDEFYNDGHDDSPGGPYH